MTHIKGWHGDLVLVGEFEVAWLQVGEKVFPRWMVLVRWCLYDGKTVLIDAGHLLNDF